MGVARKRRARASAAVGRLTMCDVAAGGGNGDSRTSGRADGNGIREHGNTPHCCQIAYIEKITK